LDKLLGNEMKSGSLIEITGKKGSGKTQISFLICAINSMNNKKIIYVEGSGNFRPERIKSMIDKYSISNVDSKEYLKNVIYQRIYELDDLFKLINKIKILNLDILILDDIIPMFLYKFRENTRLEMRSFIRELSLITLSKKIIILFTNTLIETVNEDSKNKYLRELFFHDILRYVHFKFLLQTNNNNKEIIECTLVHPYSINNTKTDIDLSYI
jgi:RecA/RadA recombinase